MGLIAWLGSALASILGASAVRFVAWKVVISALLMTVLPIVLLNVFYSIIQGVISLTTNTVSGSTGYIMQFTGLAGWFALYLKVPEGVSVLLSAMLIRVSLRLIPFVRL